MAARDAVKNLDGWVFPDGTKGNGAASAQVMWGHVWTVGVAVPATGGGPAGAAAGPPHPTSPDEAHGGVVRIA